MISTCHNILESHVLNVSNINGANGGTVTRAEVAILNDGVVDVLSNVVVTNTDGAVVDIERGACRAARTQRKRRYTVNRHARSTQPSMAYKHE
jgi:hypothetical protein